MIAIILSAGRGGRLLPLTESRPKCMLPVDCERPALEVQLRALAACGIHEVRVMIGYEAQIVEDFLATNPVPGIHVETVYNPFFDSSDNLVTAWLARPEMQGDFLLMNGDTLFEPSVLNRLLNAPEAPITLVINEKDSYDSDDMKVARSETGQLRAVSKTLPLDGVDGESIGLMRFQGEGVQTFRNTLDRAVRNKTRLGAYYLSVIDELARETIVSTVAMTGLWWGEMDSQEDLTAVREGLSKLAPAQAVSESADRSPTTDHWNARELFQ